MTALLTNALAKKSTSAPLRKQFVDGDGNINAFIEDLDVAIQERCELMRFEATRRADDIKNTYYREIMKLPKSIRTMQVREFCQKFGGNIDMVMEGERKRILQSTGLACGTPDQPQLSVVLRSAKAISKTMAMRRLKSGSLRQHSGSLDLRTRAAIGAYTTPSKGGESSQSIAARNFNGFNSGLPFTPATIGNNKPGRPLRRGESIMSMNGSPIVNAPVTSSIALALGQDPSKLDTDSLTETDKLETHKRLLELNNQITSLMEQFK